MAANNSGSAIGAGGAREARMTRISAYPTMFDNHDDAAPVARGKQLTDLLRAAIPVMAQQIMQVVPPSKRTEEERYFLSDCIRGRRAPSNETLGTLLGLQARAEGEALHAVSEAIRAVEVKLAPAPMLCALEASEAEMPIDAALDMAQLRAAREKTPTRWQEVVDAARQQLSATRRLLDAAYRQVARVA